MERTNSGFYVVDVLALKHPAGKPFHLEARLSSRQKSHHVSSPHSPTSGVVIHHSRNAARRAAFLEARRTKLARRDLHVRRVCAQHRQRVSGDSNAKLSRISKNLEAAEKNRLSILERQRQSAAQQVAHAKKVAELQHRKLEEETAAKREALEERLRHVMLRRQRLLSIPRSRLLETELWSAEEVQDLETVRSESATVIQQWWRRSKLEPLMDNFSNLKISLAKAQSMPFERLVKQMQQETVIKTTARLLSRAKKMLKNDDQKRIQWKNASRVFLSAYMIATHPTSIMPTMGQDEQNLSLSAKAMLEKFETWVDSYAGDKALQLGTDFLNAWCGFYQNFEEWKSKDTEKLVTGMIGHWMELERLWLSVRDQPNADTEWRPKIEEQQRRIQQKLSKFGKSALQRLRSEQQRVRDEFGVAVSESEGEDDGAVPMNAVSTSNPSADVLSTSPERFPSARWRRDSVNSVTSKRSSRSNTSSPDRTSRQTDGSGSGPSISVSVDRDVPVDPKLPPTPTTGTAPPELTKLVAGIPMPALTNEQLAHELIMDPDFELRPSIRSPLDERVRKMAKKAIFDIAREEFQKGVLGNYILSFIADIKQQLLAMVSDTGKIAEEINESLDIDLIRQQAQHNLFDLQKYVKYITNKMSQLCAPIRDQSIREVGRLLSTDPIGALERIFDLLEDMKLDLVNYKLRSLRPIVKQQAVEYEQAKFEKAVAAGEVSLDRTKQWLGTTVRSLQDTAAARDPENINHPASRIRFEDAYNEALLSLIFSNQKITREEVPETLLLDAERMFGFQNEAQALTIISALIMLSKNAVAELRNDRAALLKLKDTLFILLKDGDTTIDHLSAQIVATINAFLANKPAIASASSAPAKPTPTKELSEEQIQLIKTMVNKTLSFKDPVYSLLSRRIVAVVKSQLVNGSFRREGLVSAGLDVVAQELEAFSRKILFLASHNKEVYAKFYDDILKAMI
ncbi:hypothetical protein HK102_013808 [Quaeritorhiza haematococci]|nr:hypothetical protein HK102_013808 [Quaeritorhiza haematococci]